MEIRFLYTSCKSVKQAVTKTGYPKPGVNHYVTTEGKTYSECLQKAQQECGFNDRQLLGSNYQQTLISIHSVN